jgi:hypothetical protein
MNFLILLPLLLQLVGLVFAVLVDPYIRRTHRIIMMIIVGIVCCLIWQNWSEWRMLLYGGTSSSRTLAAIAGLRAFKRLSMEMRCKGGTLQAKNVDKAIMEVLEVTGFTRLFKFI